MSLHLNFEPHSHYMGWAIKKTVGHYNTRTGRDWVAYTANGMTGYIEETHADTLAALKQQIKQRTLAERERVARLYR